MKAMSCNILHEPCMYKNTRAFITLQPTKLKSLFPLNTGKPLKNTMIFTLLLFCFFLGICTRAMAIFTYHTYQGHNKTHA